MADQTVADLRARLEKATTPSALPRDHPIWRLLDALGDHLAVPAEIPDPPVPFALTVSEARDTILWLLDDLVTAAEVTSRNVVKVYEMQVVSDGWKSSATVLSQMLALMVRRGKVSLQGRAGEARRAAIKYVATHTTAEDVLPVQLEGKAALRPYEAGRGSRAGMKDGPPHAEDTAPL